jgi:hypothetical protein
MEVALALLDAHSKVAELKHSQKLFGRWQSKGELAQLFPQLFGRPSGRNPVEFF